MPKKLHLKLKPLELLDLARCQTVSDIVDAMSRCAFGARMLGEVAATLSTWCAAAQKPLIIFDGLPSSPLAKLLASLTKKSRPFFSRILTPEQYAALPKSQQRGGGGGGKTALVVGNFSERHAPALFAREPRSTIYINPFDMCAPGQIKDGYFPDAIFADPNFILPILALTLDERLQNKKHPVADLLAALAPMPGVASQVHHGGQVLQQMMQKKNIIRFLTLSGAMTIAQMSLVFCEMIDRGFIHSITSTGALMAHGLVPGLGLKHYKYNPADNDETLAKLGLNRVTDVLEPETNFDHIDHIMSATLATFSGTDAISPSILHAALGKYLQQNHPDHRAILLSAYQKNVPVFVPAFTDSELGNDVYCTNKIRELTGQHRVLMDMEKDTAKLLDLMTSQPHAGIWTFGGGVPRNWTQNVSPLIEIYNNRISETHKSEPRPSESVQSYIDETSETRPLGSVNPLAKKLPMRKYGFGIRTCPDPPHFGHLSGCTYQEGMSWRKFHFNMQQSQILADATQVQPFLVKHLMDLQDTGKLK